MLWRSLTQWLLAGCLSATALSFSVSPEGELRPPQKIQLETPAPPAFPKMGVVPSPVSPSPQQTAQVAEPAEKPKKRNQAQKLIEEGLAPAPAKPGSPEYRVQSEDELQIKVFEEPDLETRVRVSGSGEINFPLLGRVQVAGLSVMEVQEKLEKLLGEDYLVNPQVQIFIASYHARDVFVTGAVNRPGSYPLVVGKPTTVMEAITLAGGFTKAAAVNSTRIIRIENGKEKTITVRANEIIKKGDKAKDVEVVANDVIFVPESFF